MTDTEWTPEQRAIRKAQRAALSLLARAAYADLNSRADDGHTCSPGRVDLDVVERSHELMSAPDCPVPPEPDYLPLDDQSIGTLRMVHGRDSAVGRVCAELLDRRRRDP